MSLPAEFAQDLWVRKYVIYHAIISPSHLLNSSSRTLSAAGHTLLVYDYFLSLNDEVSSCLAPWCILLETFSWFQISYIWNTPWTIVKVIFLINRYGNLIGQTFILLEEADLLTNDSQEVCAASWVGIIWLTNPDALVLRKLCAYHHHLYAPIFTVNP